MLQEDREILYIGQAQRIYSRLSDHITGDYSTGSMAWKDASHLLIIGMAPYMGNIRPIDIETRLLRQIDTHYNRTVLPIK